MKLILFDDGQGQLDPLTDLRPAFDIRTGARTTLERWQDIGIAPAALLVPPHQADLAHQWHPRLPINQPVPGGAFVVNGRWPLAPRDAETIAALKPAHALAHQGTLLAAHVVEGAHDPLAIDAFETREHEALLLNRCWHVRTGRDACIAHDLARMAPDKGVVVKATARVADSAILDASAGPIVVDEHARVGHLAIVLGPAYVGPHAAVLEHATIRPNTAIGPHCKVAGEVSGTIFQGYANKAHDGFLGDSYIGMWCNLGAGTTNSNLLNTYGPVTIDRQRTGETFLGCILGDHVRTAIATRIMTGAVVGTGTMWAATAPIAGRVAPMRWATDAGQKPYRPEKFIEVATAAMARRGHAPTTAEQARFIELSDR